MKVREGYYSEQIRNQAFNSILDNLSNRQLQVYQVVEKWQPISNEMIAKHLHIKDHQVTPRVLELRQLGLLEFAGESISSTSQKKVSLWRINPKGNQLNLFT